MNVGNKISESKYESITSDSLISSGEDLIVKMQQNPENFESFQYDDSPVKEYHTPSPKCIKKQIFEDYKESFNVFRKSDSPTNEICSTEEIVIKKEVSCEEMGPEENKKDEPEVDTESVFLIRDKDTGQVYDIRKQESVVSLFENKGKQQIKLPKQKEKPVWQDFW
jgi:hypothetical protein